MAASYGSRSTATEFATTGATTLSITKPASTASGDFLIAIMWNTNNAVLGSMGVGTSGFSDSGVSFTATNSGPKCKIFTKVAGGSEPSTYSFAISGGANTATTLDLIRIPGAGQLDITPVSNQAAASTTPHTAASVTPTVAGDLLIVTYCGLTYSATPATAAITWPAPSGMTKLGDIQTPYTRSSSHYQALSTTSATGTKTSARTVANGQAIDGNYAAFSILAKSAVTAVAPTVNAGADATIDQYDPFNRTATEPSDGGATITSRAWTVVSGPNQVGATIGTAAALSWSPTVGGTYTLRYSATNSAGTGTDDVVVTVNALNFPVSAPIRIFGASSGASRTTTAARNAPMVLSADRAGSKDVAATRNAPMVLAASMVGQKINFVTAPIRLFGSLASAGRDGVAYVFAPMRIYAAPSGTSRTGTGGTRSAPMLLAASQTGAKRVASTRSAPMILAASVTGAKRVASARNAALILAAAMANGSHNGIAAPNAPIRLFAATSNRFHESVAARNAPIRLFTAVVTSSVRFNQAASAFPIRLSATAFTSRIEVEAQSIRPRADTLVKYEMLAMARVPQVSGPPVFITVDPIYWTSINWVETLNAAPTLSADVKVDVLSPDILRRMETPHELPTEIWLFRNGKQVFAGPLLGGGVRGDSIGIEALGLESYTRMWHIDKDLTFTNVDQAAIVAGLIDQWQALEYGNFGIDTSTIGTTGVLRTMSYFRKELNKVDARIDDLTKLADGFDWLINPASRKVELYSPRRGQDRSTGEDAIIFDSRNVSSSDITFSVAPGDLASDGLATGTDAGTDVPLLSTFANTELRSRWGRTSFTSNYEAGSQGALDSALAEAIGARSKVLLIPGPNTRVTLDADLASYDVGDIVRYQAHALLSASGNWRTRKRAVSVSETGTESVSLEFT